MKMTCHTSLVVMFLIATEPLLAQSGPKVSGVVIDPTAMPSKAVNGIKIKVYELGADGLPGTLLGQSKDPTPDTGIFTVQCDATADRVVVWFQDVKAGRGFTYVPTSFQALSGRQDMILNPTIVRPATQTPAAARRSMTSAVDLFRVLKSEDRASAIEYVACTIREQQPKPDFGFGEELDAVVKLLQPPKDRVAVSNNDVYHLNQSLITKWQIPVNVKSVIELDQSATMKVPSLGDQPKDAQSTIGFYNGKLWGYKNFEAAGRKRGATGIIDFGSPDVDWDYHTGRDVYTAAAGWASQPLVISGSANGSVEVKTSEADSDAVTFDVGPTPIAATTLSKNGDLWAAVTIDGSYKIWKRPVGQPIGKADVIKSGVLSTKFPGTMAFSPDNNALIVGTGLGNMEGSLTIVDLKPGMTVDPVVIKRNAAVTQITFGQDSENILARTVDGTTTIYDLERQNQKYNLKESFKLRGIETIGLLPKGDSAVLRVTGKKNLVYVPLDDLLNSKTFDNVQLGVRVQP